MCFDEKTLSAFVDKELSSARQAAIKDHIKTCSICRTKAYFFESLKEQMEVSVEEVDFFTREAVWTRLSHSISPGRGLDFWHRAFTVSPSLMLSLSFIFLAVMGVSIFFTVSNNNFDIAVSNSEFSYESEKYPLGIPIDDVENILAYFDIQDEPMEFFIQLPASSNFVIQGEPIFLKKNDYVAGR